MVAFEAVLRPWADVKWSAWKEKQHNKLKELDDEEATVLEGRRTLVRQTKELKSLPEEEQTQRRSELFKLYQQEIDRFTTIIRKLHADFRSEVSVLCDLPDPTPILLEFLEQLNSGADADVLRKENSDLRNALNKSESDLAELNAKLESKDAIVRSGAEQVKHLMAQVISLRQELEQKGSSVNELVAALAEQEKIAMVASNRLQETCKRSDELSIEVGRLRKTNEELHKGLQEQLRRKDQEETVQWAEFDVLNLNLRTARAQIVELQGENEILRADLASLQETSGAPSNDLTQRLEKEIAELKEKIKATSEAHLRQMAEKDAQIMDWRRRAGGMCDLEKSLEELRFLKAAEFPDQYNQGLDQPLEALLRGQVKKLEGELVLANGQSRELTKQLDTLKTELTTKDNCIIELERAVERYEASAANLSPPADAISLQSNSSLSTQNVDSIVAILTNQRDRLRKQKEDIEDKYTAVYQQLECQKIELSRLRSDNTKLTDKIKLLPRFLEGKIENNLMIDSELGGLLDHGQSMRRVKLDSFGFFLRNVPDIFSNL